jgi:gamma-glutamylcyclotransferase (GGCT)/AIG2-like uncharacterized protein YtfP
MRLKDIDDVIYFAYGHNTDTETITVRCPSADLIGNGILKNFQLSFGSFANIENRDNTEVHGVLWKISRKDLKILDKDEGFHKNYVRIPVEVHSDNGPVAALAYIMEPDYDNAKPLTKEYIGALSRGYAEHHLPLDQLKTALRHKFKQT